MAISPKHFKKREAILAYLRQTDTHPSAEMVFWELKPQIPDLSLGTVYRNLSAFRQRGDIVSIGTVGGVERFDGNTAPHVHFICNQCNSVTDMHRISLPAQVCDEAGCYYGCQVEACQLTITGQCQSCLALRKEGETA